MRPYPLLALSLLLAVVTLPELDAQTQRPSPERDAPERQAPERRRPRRPTAKLARWEIAAGTGLTAGVLTGVPQAAPTLQVNVGYAVSPRLTLGVAFSRAVFAPRPYVDENDVVSHERTLSRHYGVRAKGVILRRGITQVYGGIQLGVTTSEATYAHEFPEALQVESVEAYLHNRASPFYDAGDQVGAIGFLGISARVWRHVEVYTELGNNLALLNAGAAVVF